MRLPVRFVGTSLFVLAILIVGFLERGALRDAWISWRAPALPPAVSFEEIKEADPRLPTPERSDGGQVGTSPTPVEPSAPAPAPMTSQAPINLAVPFTPQAPYANWDEFHEEACEEASLLMVHRFYEGERPGLIDPSSAEEDIQAIARFEDAIFGYNTDTTAAQTGVVAEQFYGYERVETIDDPTVEDLKRHLTAGRPVIVPAAGRELGNPYFTPPGPEYHMLVLRGFTSAGFITNDPGTRRGEGMVYSFDTIMGAMHDWNTEDINKGAKTVLVIYPNP